MHLYLIPILWFLASAKVTIQSKFSKSKSKELRDNVFFNAVMFSAIALMFLPALIINGALPETVLYAAILGVLSVFYQIFYVCAFAIGKTSLTVMINNFSLLIPTVFSHLVYGDELGLLKIIGILLVLVSFMLNVSKEPSHTKASAKQHILWLLFTLAVFLSNGLSSITQKVYANVTPEYQVFEYVAVSYITASTVSWVIFLLLKKKQPADPQTKPHISVIPAAVTGFILGIFQCVNTYSVSVIDATVLYPVMNCGVSVLLVLIGKVFFHEKLTVKQWITVVLGVISIALISI